MQAALQALEDTYFTLQSQVDELSLACTTEEQHTQLKTQYVQARQNYWACISKAFHDDDPQVISLTSQIDAANQGISTSIERMGDIATVLNDIASAVTIGGQLAAKVIAL